MNGAAKHNRNQQGAALIFALLLTLLLTGLLGLSMQLVDLQIYQLQRGQNQAQARQYLLGGEALARQLLMRQSKQSSTHLNQLWAREDTILPIEGGQLKGSIRDLQSCFNLNGVLFGYSAGQQQGRTLVMQQLLALMSLNGIGSQQADILLARLVDWLDADTTPFDRYGAESPDYLRASEPFQSADQLLLEPGELLQITTLDGPLTGLAKLVSLRPFCVLPTRDLPVINLNTLKEEDAPLLSALFFYQINSQQALELIQQRPVNGYENSDQFWQQLGTVALSSSQRTLLKQQLRTRSSWFEINIAVELDNQLYRLQSQARIAPGRPLQLYSRRYGS
ncbi:MAG: type II secretion system minor pseudopilin GspK [Marinobacterium sp.]|nr:type II secretion system minor pseudopilin GspK [Marinobacterium sp.]